MKLNNRVPKIKLFQIWKIQIKDSNMYETKTAFGMNDNKMRFLINIAF